MKDSKDHIIDQLKNLKGPQPDPYFASRVLAHHQYSDEKKKVFVWKLISGLCLTLGSFFSFYFFQKNTPYKFDYQKAPIHKSMMLVLTEVPNDYRIAYVSLEIDEGMTFDIANASLRSKKEITLAIDSDSLKLGRLPFVFMAVLAGKKNVKVKYLDAEFEVVKHETYYLDFFDLNNTNKKPKKEIQNEKVFSGTFSPKPIAS
ncbi:MAG: hypothetical protein AABY53_10480 [Bdellovibrionota bacterium]